MSNRLPVYFISHGSPMLALGAGRFGDAWAKITEEIETPKAILMISAHWTTVAPVVSAAEKPETIHDFGGFPRALFEVQYPTVGAPWLAERVADLLQSANWPVAIHPDRGLDHGAWVPLQEMYPMGEIPVAQLSIQPRQDPAYHYRLGKLLAPLREEGVLILASGSITHNLGDIHWHRDHDDNFSEAWATEFQSWVSDQLLAGQTDAMLQYRANAPHAHYAHPHDDHFMPLYVTMGAGDGEQVDRLFDGTMLGTLAMDVYRFGGVN
ncbi:dioxygenase [Leeia sp. TBRC 13508]|uniref:Dioxygenase n=1 Tax=Leeia speluncae TaxID=2884804 RepID=A0ABS8D2S0_9NEIS|nr:class III extradiol ring-cleavage dioxygenase [Leeia speluncae]MCB6182497.1 dioxygenase [Leeia speluncae]